MTRLRSETRGLLKDDVIAVLYDVSPKSLFASEIALELRRDKEFVKGLLLELEKIGVVERVLKGYHGNVYTKRIRWRIPAHVLKAMQGWP